MGDFHIHSAKYKQLLKLQTIIKQLNITSSINHLPLYFYGFNRNQSDSL
jgi:hypothetical protein